MHADDYDDTYHPTRFHPTAPVLSAVCAVGAGGAVGTGMVVRGEHYPTDVVGGFCTAVAAVLVVALVVDAVAGRRGPASVTTAPDGVR